MYHYEKLCNIFEKQSVGTSMRTNGYSSINYLLCVLEVFTEYMSDVKTSLEKKAKINPNGGKDMSI